MTYVLRPDQYHRVNELLRTLGFPFKQRRTKMKTFIAALALLSLAAGATGFLSLPSGGSPSGDIAGRHTAEKLLR
jgi:hypothetical protein